MNNKILAILNQDNNIKKSFKIRSAGLAFRNLILVFFTVIQIFPLAWMVAFSLKDNEQIATQGVLALPEIYRWDNYGVIFSQLKIYLYLMNSFKVAVLSVLLTIILATMAAYALTRMKWKLQKPARMFFLTGIMISPHIALLPMFLMFKTLGIIDKHLSLVIPYVAFILPTSIFILSGFFRVIPKEFEEAACIDGSSIYRTFFTIILPIMKTPIATISIFAFLQSWNELMFALTFINKASMKTMPVAALSFQGLYTIDWGFIGASMVVATIPTLIVYLLLSEQVQKSLTAGALKG